MYVCIYIYIYIYIYISIVVFFCHFPVIIVQILSFEQKLLLGTEYPFKTPKNNS